MYSRGHIGLSLIIISLLLKTLGVNPDSLTISTFVLLFSTFPDIDLKLGTAHRGLSHSIFFSVLIAFLFSLILYRLSGDQNLLFTSFTGSAIGMISHILGDLLTLMKFRPLWPLSKRTFSFGLFRSENRIVNEGLFLAGLLSIFLSLRSFLQPF
ncbi:MAG: metal-dependent hydrolase [Archaeoglobi archaeon]|nr:metal-dependent hydrolase [Candidatus Mnemosynella bozhongmuii]